MKSIAFRVLGALAACLAMAGAAPAQTAYPDKPVRLVVPYSPGGSTSVLANALATALGKSLGQSVYIDHRPGGNTIIGTGAVAKAAPDGYTLLLTASSHVVVPLITKAPYDPFKDFTPVATLAKTEFVLVVNPKVNAQNLKEFVALAKTKPGAVTYASAGNGSGTHLVAEQFERVVDIRMQHIPYKGAGPLVNDLLGGQVNAAFLVPAVATQFIQSNRLRAIAVSGKERQSMLPSVPTLSELGVGSLNATNWYGVLAPAGIPKDVAVKVANAIQTVGSHPDFKETLSSLGLQPYSVKSDEFDRMMREESARMAALIKSANITMD
ncbi:tripartite tricarboxylate transporter substrate binding protein [Cupriavidus necator]|uniref:Bug family tripartite tricarboxylate transporter substrate binding protein n=1 Tax=Cupriavidus necator TaxID=106590 RepID=UPI00339D6681